MSKILLKAFQAIVIDKFDTNYYGYLDNREALSCFYFMPGSTSDTGACQSWSLSLPVIMSMTVSVS